MRRRIDGIKVKQRVADRHVDHKRIASFSRMNYPDTETGRDRVQFRIRTGNEGPIDLPIRAPDPESHACAR
jgi:hypothetical protein